MQSYLLTTLDGGTRVVTEPLPAVRSVAIGLWIGLLTLPLHVRPVKLGRDMVRFENQLGRFFWIEGKQPLVEAGLRRQHLLVTEERVEE